MIAGAILAGGRSSRMGGGDKMLALLHGETILSRIIARLKPQVALLALNGNGDAARFADFGLPVVPDRLMVQKGPIGGLHASLEWAAARGADQLLTVTSDVPFIPVDLASRLAAAGAPSIAVSGAHVHFAIGLWPVSLLPSIVDAVMNQNLFRMKDWVALCGAKHVRWDVAGHDPFFNINTPEDLAMAEGMDAA